MPGNVIAQNWILLKRDRDIHCAGEAQSPVLHEENTILRISEHRPSVREPSDDGTVPTSIGCSEGRGSDWTTPVPEVLYVLTSVRRTGAASVPPREVSPSLPGPRLADTPASGRSQGTLSFD